VRHLPVKCNLPAGPSAVKVTEQLLRSCVQTVLSTCQTLRRPGHMPPSDLLPLLPAGVRHHRCRALIRRYCSPHAPCLRGLFPSLNLRVAASTSDAASWATTQMSTRIVVESLPSSRYLSILPHILWAEVVAQHSVCKIVWVYCGLPESSKI